MPSYEDLIKIGASPDSNGGVSYEDLVKLGATPENGEQLSAEQKFNKDPNYAWSEIVKMQLGKSDLSKEDQLLLEKWNREQVGKAMEMSLPATEIPGLGKLANWLRGKADRGMQYAAGMKNYIPGVGKEMIDQGIWGTRSGIEKGTQEAIDRINSEAEGLLAKSGSKIKSSDVADNIINTAKDKFTVNGLPGTNLSSKVDDAIDIAANIEKRGDLDPLDALKFKRLAGKEAYQANKEIPGLTKNKPLAPIYRAEERGYAKALSEVSPEAADLFSKESKLLSAFDALSKPERNTTKLSDFLYQGGAGVGGAVLSGGTGAAGATGLGIGSALMGAARSPLARSISAHLLDKSAAVPEVISKYKLLDIPVRRALVEATYKDEK